MGPKKSLKTILGLSIAGLIFSGYLSYQELFRGGCNVSFVRCDSGFSLLGQPACVYGFFMYFAIFLLSLSGLKKKR